MARIFKTIATTALVFFLVQQNSFGQDSSKILNETWLTLRAQFLRRTDAVTVLVNILQQNKNIDSEILRQLNTNKSYLINLLNSPNQFDSSIIANIHYVNDNLSVSINKVYNILLNDKSFVQSDGFIYVATELEGTENRIYIAVKDYNEACKNIARHDLYFKKLWGDEQ